MVDYSDDDTTMDQTGEGIRKRWLRQNQAGEQKKRIRSSSNDSTASNTSSTPASDTIAPDHQNITLPPEAPDDNNNSSLPASQADSTLADTSEAQANSTLSDMSSTQASSTTSEAQIENNSEITSTENIPPDMYNLQYAQNTNMHSEAQNTNGPSTQQSTSDQSYYFVLGPEQVANVVSYQVATDYGHTPTYTTLTPTVTFTNLNQFHPPTVTYTAEPLIYTQQQISQEAPAVAAEVTTTGEMDHSLEIDRYDHKNDPNLRTTCYSSVGSDSDCEKIEPRRVRISMELLRATNLIQKKLAQKLDEFHASSSGSSTHSVPLENYTESEVEKLLTPSDDDT
ncbi:MAG: hypothetical protein ACK583_17635, partial [Cyanobacteriota bacterium]